MHGSMLASLCLDEQKRRSMSSLFGDMAEERTVRVLGLITLIRLPLITVVLRGNRMRVIRGYARLVRSSAMSLKRELMLDRFCSSRHKEASIPPCIINGLMAIGRKGL